MKKFITRSLLVFFGLLTLLFLLYFNNTSLVDPVTQDFYRQLKAALKEKGYSHSLLVISTKRVDFHNELQVRFSGAARDSRHLSNQAIDFLVFDVNNDGKSNAADVDIVYRILDSNIIGNKGGIGTYKNEKGFINHQMIHIDSRGYRSRWAR